MVSGHVYATLAHGSMKRAKYEECGGTIWNALQFNPEGDRQMSPRRAGALPLLLRLDPEAKQPLNQQIYQGLRSAILDGRLHVGTRLPSSRMLATDLSISRNTVLNAYESLVIEGYLHGESGGGTRVSTELPDDILRARAPLARETPKQTRRKISKRAMRIADVPLRLRIPELPRRLRAFRIGACALDEFPTAVWGQLV